MPDSNKKQLTQEEMLQRRGRMKTILLVVAALVFLGCVLGILFAVGIIGPDKTGGLDGTYICQLTEDNGYVFHLNLNAETAEFTQTVEEDTMSSGSYRVKDGQLTLTTNNESSVYDIVGDYLLGCDYYYEGEVPDGPAFDATLTQVTDAFTLTLDFSADGTYTSTLVSGNGGEETAAVTEGVYTREGDFLNRTRIEEDGTEHPAPRLLVLNGKANSRFFLKDAAAENK